MLLNFRQIALKKGKFFILLENLLCQNLISCKWSWTCSIFPFWYKSRCFILFTCTSFVLSWAKSVGIGKMLNLVLPVCQNVGLRYLYHCYSSKYLFRIHSQHAVLYLTSYWNCLHWLFTRYLGVSGKLCCLHLLCPYKCIRSMTNNLSYPL